MSKMLEKLDYNEEEFFEIINQLSLRIENRMDYLRYLNDIPTEFEYTEEFHIVPSFYSSEVKWVTLFMVDGYSGSVFCSYEVPMEHLTAPIKELDGLRTEEMRKRRKILEDKLAEEAKTQEEKDLALLAELKAKYENTPKGERQ